MKVLITGGAGFLGYHLAALCAERGAEVSLLDLAEADSGEYPPGTRAATGDVRDPGAVTRALREHGLGPGDAVVHAAAALPLWRPADIRSTNVEGTRTVLAEARRAGVERVVYVSSTAVYGVPEKHPIEEVDPLVGVGPYGESKIAAERVCADFRGEGYCVPVLRPKTFLGTGRLGVFQILYDWVHDGKRIPVLGSGNNRYQLLEVDDLCDAIWRALTAPAGVANGTFNVGATRFSTVKEDVAALCAYAGSGARVFPVPAWPAKLALRALESVNLSPLYRWVYGTADKDSFVSVDRIRESLGWEPRYSNAEALIRAYEWYLAHRQEVAASGAKTGITHRVAWNQGALRLLKRFM
ncbi:MAG TPA: NAD(P)-dependent oxidoreductase [Chloroflexota bacterium]|nr:NAD(P)-dependent oxidoreductase [Chloroflexota bacterium]